PCGTTPLPTAPTASRSRPAWARRSGASRKAPRRRSRGGWRRAATDSGARVINLSLGGTSSSQTELNAVNYALGKGVVVVAAAGNEYDQGNPKSYPAAFPGVVAVGSASNDDQH